MIIDDGSTDFSLEVAKEYEALWPTVRVFTQPNGGCGTARNHGLRHAQGRYIWFVDSDDCICDDALDKIAALLTENYDNIDVFMSGYLIKDSKTKKISNGHLFYYKQLSDLNITLNVSFSTKERPQLARHSRLVPWNKLYRKDFIVENEIRFPGTRVNEDVPFVLFSFFCAKSIKVVSDVLYIYTQGQPGSIVTSAHDARRLTSTQILDECCNFSQRTPLSAQELVSVWYKIIENLIGNASVIQKQLAPQLLDYLDVVLKRAPIETLIELRRDDSLPNLKHHSYYFYVLQRIDAHIVRETCRLRAANKPLLSVIVAACGLSRTVKECLDRLTQQTLGSQYFEVIMAHPQSGRVAEVCLEYARRHENFVSAPVDGVTAGAGAVAAFYQKGWSEASGEYACFFDSEVICHENAFQTLLIESLTNKADLLITALREEPPYAWRTNGNPWVRAIRPQFQKLNLAARKFLLHSLAPAIWRSIYRRDLLEKMRLSERPELFENPYLWHWESVQAAEAVSTSPQQMFVRHSKVPAKAAVVSSADGLLSLATALNHRPTKEAKVPGPEIQAALTYRLIRLRHHLAKLPKELKKIYRAKLAKSCPPLANRNCKRYRLLFFSHDGYSKVLHDYFASRGFFPLARCLRNVGQKLTAAVLWIRSLSVKDARAKLQQKFHAVQGRIAWELSPGFRDIVRLKNTVTAQNTLINHILVDAEPGSKLMRSIRRNITVAAHHQRVFLPYKNIYQGREVVIVATGPSMKFYASPIEGAIHIGVNKAFKADNIPLDYLFAVDYKVFKDYCNELPKSPNAKAHLFYGLHQENDTPAQFFMPEGLVLKHGADRYYIHANLIKRYKWPRELALDLATEALADNGTVVDHAMQFALYTNPKKIYLVGCDCSVNGHFDGQQQASSASALDRWTMQIKNVGWPKMKEFVALYYPETEIFSINPVGLKGMFKDLYTDENGRIIGWPETENDQ
jgi:glycosyltransferase involved in cell wall biosynthesis